MQQFIQPFRCKGNPKPNHPNLKANKTALNDEDTLCIC